MTLLLLRHAKAGDRSSWPGNDRDRPVSDDGRRQAEALVAQYAPRPLSRILTSPYVRCIQTVEPLAVARDLGVEESNALAEGAPLAVAHWLVAGLAGADAVLCTHGDVVAALITDLGQRGFHVGDDPRWQKGSTWVLDGDLDRPTATYLPPPA